MDDQAAKQNTAEERAEAERVASLRHSFLHNLLYIQGKFPALATPMDHYLALAHAVRERLLQRWLGSTNEYLKRNTRTVAYLSAEFLMGPHLGNNLVNLGMLDAARKAMRGLGLHLDDLLEQEEEPGLGNGGLGRLAACFIDSLATLEIPSIAYGIRYEFGIFHQTIVDGWQMEKTDHWLRFGNPWELQRPEWAREVKFGGHTEKRVDAGGRLHIRWIPGRIVNGIPYDTPILGYRNNTANTLRLWSAEAPESFDFQVFNRGDYNGAVNQKIVSENLSKVLYPNDEHIEGKILRLEQQYFFVSCSLQDMLKLMLRQHVPLTQFHEKFAVQLNDTHPAIAVAELMRLLIDEHDVPWIQAWDITRKTFGYTNHTLMPEALERWPLELFARVLPRHLEIINEINARFCEEVRLRWPGDEARVWRMSLIEEHGERYVRMAHLACVGSHAINGVAELHTQLLKQDVLKDFHELWPEKFRNKTNGVTPRRWMALSNPRLSRLITDFIGPNWIRDLDELRGLEAQVENADFRAAWREIKRANKRDLAELIRKRCEVAVDPTSMFDVQVKRIHEYKRQHLSALHIVALYRRLKANPHLEVPPRTFIFGGKAAPGYRMAKLMIRLITAIGEVVNRDPAVRDRLRVVFIPDFSVSCGQHVYPGADLSEQISTAGKEASGTGNMKFQMNGALTIGTMDGANIEIREQVGAENFFLFGMNAQQVGELRAQGYRPRDWYQTDPELREALDLIASGHFTHGDGEVFSHLIEGLLAHDPYFLLADFRAYADCQSRVGEVYGDMERWTRMSILNTARSGLFSSDRSIREYCRDIWKVEAVPVQLMVQDDIDPDFQP